MNDHGQSDERIVPQKPPNADAASGGGAPAEVGEGRRSATGKANQDARPRTQSRTQGLSAVLARLRAAVKRDREAKLTALYHHIYNVDHLREGFAALKREAAPGVDGVTWQAYAQNLEANLQDLAARLQRRAYRATPVRRVYIPKPDGRQRGLGVPILEDKLVQWVTAQLLSTIWEEEFLGFSYGFRPGRSPHQALDALTVGIETKRVNWVLDADLRAFFDTLGHAQLVQFLQHRIGDPLVIRLIQKWLKAGVLEEGHWNASEAGTPQGGIISPVLANIYLHYAFDQWVQHWRTHQAHGDVVVVRYADDFVVGFEQRADAQQFQQDLTARLAKFGLALHAEKTRLIEFGRYAAANRRGRGVGKPETFSFLGFTHICGKTRKGKFTVLRQTARKRMRAKLQQLKLELKRRRHEPLPQIGAWLGSVLRGHYQYYGVPRNSPALCAFRYELIRLWKRALERRSQRGRLTWERMSRLARRWLPIPHICHPYPNQRLHVRT